MFCSHHTEQAKHIAATIYCRIISMLFQNNWNICLLLLCAADPMMLLHTDTIGSTSKLYASPNLTGRRMVVLADTNTPSEHRFIVYQIHGSAHIYLVYLADLLYILVFFSGNIFTISVAYSWSRVKQPTACMNAINSSLHACTLKIETIR